MAKVDILDLLYSKKRSPLEFNFDALQAPPLLSLLTVEDIAQLNKIAKSLKYAGKIDTKYKLIDEIVSKRGFAKLHAGTNRVVYRFKEDQSFVIKIALDRVGLNDNPAEFKNQQFLKPFVTKCFEVSPCGTVGLFERVDPILSREEFMSVANDIFKLITKFFIGKYVIEDFGTHYFMNWGIRFGGMGLCLLDFPYVYEIDSAKLYCTNQPDPMFPPCDGEIDYDDGFNNLICTKCGKVYQARDLQKGIENGSIRLEGGKHKMKVILKYGGEIINSGQKETKHIEIPNTKQKQLEKFSTRVYGNDINSTEASSSKKETLPDDIIFNKKSNDEESKNIKNISSEKDTELKVASSNDSDENYEDYDDYTDDYDIYEEEYMSNRERQGKSSGSKKHKDIFDKF